MTIRMRLCENGIAEAYGGGGLFDLDAGVLKRWESPNSRSEQAPQGDLVERVWKKQIQVKENCK